MPISLEHARELARLIEHETKPDLVLIGAVALGHHVPLGRHTSDVDLAVVVSLDDITGELPRGCIARDARAHQPRKREL